MSLILDPSRPGVVASSAVASVAVMAPVARLSIRVRNDMRADLAKVLGVDLPDTIGQRAKAGDVEAVCLGPDEWLVIAPLGHAPKVVQAAADAYAKLPHSLVEVSEREITVEITGAQADILLTLGMPRDVDSIKVGEARRTVFDGATVVIWRDAQTSFRMDIWRSFAPHVVALLATGCTELEADAALT